MPDYQQGKIYKIFNTITDEQGNFRPGIYATADPPGTESRGGDIWFNKNFSESNLFAIFSLQFI